jgi:hypothetical protein
MFLFGLLCSLDPEVASVLGVFPQVKLQSSTKDAVMLHLLIHHVGEVLFWGAKEYGSVCPDSRWRSLRSS